MFATKIASCEKSRLVENGLKGNICASEYFIKTKMTENIIIKHLIQHKNCINVRF